MLNSARRSVALVVSLLVFCGLVPSTVLAAGGPAVIATIGLGPDENATAFALAVNSRTHRTYVTPGAEASSCESHVISVIDNATNALLPPITAGINPFGVAINEKTNKLYVANTGGCTVEQASNTVSVIDGATDTIIANITLAGLGPTFPAVNSRSNKIYVAMNGGCCESGTRVAVIDGSTDTVLRYVDVDPDPFLVFANPKTNLVYVTHAFADKITVIDGETDTVKTTFSIGSEARGIDFHPNGKLVYVAARNTNVMAVVDASTHAVLRRIPVGLRPHGLLFDPDTSRIYVTNRGRCDSTPGTVSVIDSETLNIVTTLQVGACPRFLDRDRDTGRVYVPNASTSRSVSVIDGSK